MGRRLEYSCLHSSFGMIGTMADLKHSASSELAWAVKIKMKYIQDTFLKSGSKMWRSKIDFKSGGLESMDYKTQSHDDINRSLYLLISTYTTGF